MIYSDLNEKEKMLFNFLFEKYIYSDLNKEEFKRVLNLLVLKIDGKLSRARAKEVKKWVIF